MSPPQGGGESALCEWCRKCEATKTVNLPGNALNTNVCDECHEEANAAGGNWQEVCERCDGSGDLGDGLSPCPDCQGEGYADA